jgi:hypothetical protein
VIIHTQLTLLSLISYLVTLVLVVKAIQVAPSTGLPSCKFIDLTTVNSLVVLAAADKSGIVHS